MEKIRFALGWVKHNKIMTIVYMLVLSFIVCSDILLIQFYVSQSTYEEGYGYYYAFYFDERLNNDIADELIDRLTDKVSSFQELKVASNINGYQSSNDYAVAAYLVYREENQIERNKYFSYGRFMNEDGTFVTDTIQELDFIQGAEFKKTGEGTVMIGDTWADSLITANDYKKYVDGLDVIEITLGNNKEKDLIIEEIDLLGINYKIVDTDGFLASGLESVKFMMLITVMLLIFSLYASLAFVEIFINMQRKDIAVYYRCGARRKDLNKMYLGVTEVAGILSYIIGALLSYILISLLEFNFDKISLFAYIIGFVVFMMVYSIEAILYVRLTLKYIGKGKVSAD